MGRTLPSEWGVNYLHKNFASAYGGNFVDDPTGEAHWESSDVWNPDGRSSDKNSLFRFRSVQV